ncbi:phosphodiester glycosidase family protein [Paenibacillus chungangensis]|uniref:Phosphodiester glycosidase family protein n=1 Tax=Paenibacillus chungangensis TaxID=696535 RepID=A0ABW3HLX5_9BACL
MQLSVKLFRLLVSVMVMVSIVFSSQTIQPAALANSPTLISNAVELELIRSNPSGNYRLMEDIELTTPFTPIPSFSGTLDGNGHTITGLTITASASQPKAAFIVQNSGVISQVGFKNVNITGLSTNSTYRAGGIVESNYGTIEESYVTGSIVGGYRSAGVVVTNYGQVHDVYADVVVEAAYESGAIAAVSESGSILERVYAVPDVYSINNNTGGLSAYAYTGAVIRDSALLSGTIDNGGGNRIARIVGRLNGTPTMQNNIASVNALVQGMQVSGGTANNNQGLTVAEAVLSQQNTYEDLGWDFQNVWKMSAVLKRPVLRDVAEVQPTSIATAADLELIRSNPAGDYRLVDDIELTQTFTPISAFSGTLDGDGHVIRGLTIIASASQPKAAFMIENRGIISRLGFEEVVIVGSNGGASYWASGIAASNYGLINGTYVTGVVTGAHRSAGIAAHNYGVVRNSFTKIKARARAESGGIVAVSEPGSVLEYSFAVPEVYSTDNNTGGISAYAYSGAIIRNNVLLEGTIDNDGGSRIGRIVGRLNGSPTLQNNIASADALVQGAAVSGGTLNNYQGLTVTNASLSLQATYEGKGWNFDTVWEMRAASNWPIQQYFADVNEAPAHPIIHKVLRDENQVLSTGVSHRQMDFIDSAGYIQKANIIDVDISLPQNSIIVGTLNNQTVPTDASGNYIRTVDSAGHDIFKATVAVQAATTHIAGKQVIAGVNGEFYTVNGPEGYMIKDGSSIINGVRVPGADAKNYPFHGFFGIKSDGTAMIGNYGADWEAVKNDLYQASGGQYWMVKDGIVQDFNGQVISDANDLNYDHETYYRHKDRHPRTAVGIKSDGNVFFVVIDGRKANDSSGFYIEELGLYMKELGAYQALNMDGGGSSTAVTWNEQASAYQIKNTPINGGVPGSARDVFSSLLILAEETL